MNDKCAEDYEYARLYCYSPSGYSWMRVGGEVWVCDFNLDFYFGFKDLSDLFEEMASEHVSRCSGGNINEVLIIDSILKGGSRKLSAISS